MDANLKRKSQLAWGIAVICGLFLLETWNANRLMPNAASPVIWAVLGLVGVGSAGVGLWFGWRSSRQGGDEGG